jgi:hypothetical protein
MKPIRWILAILLGAAISYVHVTNAIAAPNETLMIWNFARILPAIGLTLTIGRWEEKRVRELGLFIFVADFIVSFMQPIALVVP